MIKIVSSCFLFLFGLTIFSSCKQTSPVPNQKINAVLGDVSLIEKYGVVPDDLSENERIQTHLIYVEKMLRERATTHLSEQLKASRAALLDQLHQYIGAGVFPKNYDFPGERRPCFIDQDGNICAVGYLIEQTAGRPIAEKINAAHQYDRIFDMETPELLAWVENSGLTLEECAMIQPAYGPPPSYNYNYISTGYGLPSAILGGTNLSLNAVNLIQIAQGSENKIVPILGLASGVGAVILGAANFEKDYNYGYSMYPNTNESKTALSMLNIGLGTSTVILSAWNLLADKTVSVEEKKVSWNVYSFPTETQAMGVGFSLKKKF
ncbi:hypothetical protein I5M27_08985 [Adhaeribacter sp. BT258]|uniref:Uncharacterized protein n=1 Tax=Adhaeribacter terrigena TaxID=2793070 RepID=A0ABS1C1Q1_9BACT|nr:hypothetical protein [Adhaeribacter terrigena]MBK0403117.1 hypothetical protein [Adhaeribacter terrigena]